MRPPSLCSFIYALSLDGVNFRYVGMTSSTWAVRWACHSSAARRVVLPGARRKVAVHCWIQKYGIEAVQMTVLEVCADPADLPDAERRWVAKLREDGHALLNHTDGGEGATGWQATPEQRAAQAARMTGEGNHNFGKPRPVEVKEAIATALRGRPGALKGIPKTEEHKAKLRGRRVSEETRQRMSEAAKARGANNRGKPMSEEQKRKISAAHKGRKLTPEHRARMSEAHRGRPKSAEHRAALSESIRRAHARKREDQGPVQPGSEC